MKTSCLSPLLFTLIVILSSCEKEEISSDEKESITMPNTMILRGVEMIDESYFVNIKNNENNQPTILYISSSLENDIINSDYVISETEYASDSKIESYKQQISDLEDPVFYNYTANKVDLTFLEGGSYQSVDLPYVGSGITSIHNFNQTNPFLVNSLGSDTIFYETENGNITKISNSKEVLYEYAYDNNPYFGKGILYDFFSSEFGFQWWYIPELVPKNNIISIKKYVYADGSMWTPDEDEEYIFKFTYEYNENGYPIEMKLEDELWMKFHYHLN